jgi:hypothetical protein
VLAVVSGMSGSARARLVGRLRTRRRLIWFTEALFLAALAAMTVLRAFSPGHRATESP